MSRRTVPSDLEPPRLLDDFRREMKHLVANFLGGQAGASDAFVPRANIAETEGAFEVTIDLPGMKPEDFRIEVGERQVSITGERKCECEERGKTFHRVERQHGRFRRTIPLEAALDVDRAVAEYKDGVLQITVPKSEATKPRRIQIKDSSESSPATAGLATNGAEQPSDQGSHGLPGPHV